MKQNCSIKRKKTSTYVEDFISLFYSDFEFHFNEVRKLESEVIEVQE